MRPASGRCAVHQRRWDDGRTLQRAPLGPEIEATFGAPYYHLHRADLANLLAAALPAERAACRPRSSSTSSRTASRVSARFDNGSAVEADSAGWRRRHPQPRASRRVRPREAALHRLRRLARAGAGREGCVISASRSRRTTGWGRTGTWFTTGCRPARFMNVVCVVEHGDWTSDSWTDKGNVADALRRATRAGIRSVRSLISAFPETYIWALHDRLPLPQWSAGRVTLLGDARHPMLPFMAQGARAVDRGWCGTGVAAQDHAGRHLHRAASLRGDPQAARNAPAGGRAPTTARASICTMVPTQQKRDTAMANSGDRSIANIGWLYAHDAADVG